LLSAIHSNRRYPYVLAPRQSGKSSLIVHTIRTLDPQLYYCLFIDLSTFPVVCLGDYEAFLAQLVARCVEAFCPSKESGQIVGLQEALDVVLRSCSKRVVIIIDEVDVLLTVPFKDSFLSLVRSIFNERAWKKEFTRVQFVLSGTGHPTKLISDPLRSP